MDSFHFLNSCLYSWSGMNLFVFVLMTSLFCFKFLRYFVIVGDISNDLTSAFLFNNSWENEVKLSVPISDRSGSMVDGVSWDWFRWRELLSVMTYCSIISGSLMVLNCNLIFLCHSSLYFHQLGCLFFELKILFCLMLSD